MVLIGPAHRLPVQGLCVPSVDYFETPLGRVPLDRASIDGLRDLTSVCTWDAPHAEEHALEVHLPFLQTVLREFRLVPLLAGDASGDVVADVLERLWGGPETLIVVSSDLSHYLDYASAQRLDLITRHAIEALDAGSLHWEQACGRVPLMGLLTLARRRQLAVETLDLRNSGDTAGDKRRVVGYGAWAFFEPGTSARRALADAEADASSDVGPETRGLLDRHGPTLLQLASAAIAHGLRWGRVMPVVATGYAEELQAARASFVTLTVDGQLRGCIGSLQAFRPLVEDVAANAYAAAFRDDRFDRLDAGEQPRLQLSVSVLNEPEELHFDDEPHLLAQLRVGRDGLIIRSGTRRALFLPQVWETLAEPQDFLHHLKVKAGLDSRHASTDLDAWRFTVESVSSVGTSAEAIFF